MTLWNIFNFFHPSSKQKKKVIVRSRPSSTLNPEQEAQEDLIRLFPTMACGQIEEIKHILLDARNLYEPKKTKKIRTLLPELVKLKKQSVSFGYPLISDVATHLEKIIQKASSFSEPEFTMMHKDVLLLQEILWKKIRGDGGEKGRKILNQLTRIPK